ncbi:unnamed protein product [Acanthoscelides obtectus]|uniref:E3 ubiquitin-protein ligase n=1 Tax=Acanthoscelides obtectus TaxID=200917 RepID=A0A9P0M3E8_ACAOB|nr:unnamed protein product [Acanthoscelides obtectus]CAK1644542.1 E3 ubiquitin-protein ligase RNF146 [Acanthoscelides obtectus]
MAEAVIDLVSDESEIKSKNGNLECPVCLQGCVHPAKLPCGHVFCYLCIKGFANQNKKCAMCRQEVPMDFLEHPNLLERLTLEDVKVFEDGYQWFYEGRNGWWRYDERANEEIEEAFKAELPNFELIICGELYVVDFKSNYQYSKRCPTRKRAIRRDKIDNVVVKGVAGIR